MRTRTRMKTRKRLDVSFSYRRHVVVLVPAQGHEVAAREARPREVKRDERRVQRGHRLEDARSRGVDPARAVTVQVNHRRRGRKLRLTPAPAALARVSACGGDSPGGVTFRLLRCAAPDGALQRVAFVVGRASALGAPSHALRYKGSAAAAPLHTPSFRSPRAAAALCSAFSAGSLAALFAAPGAAAAWPPGPSAWAPSRLPTMTRHTSRPCLA
jgi:hypothetical protein